MSKIIKLPIRNAGKFDLKPVKRSKEKPEDSGQLDLFEQGPKGKVVELRPESGTFGAALNLHESNPAQAIAMYKRAIDLGDHVADAYCNLAILESNAGNIAKAINGFTKSLESEPRHFEAHFNLANLYADAGNLDLSIVHYEVAAELASDDPNIFYNLALVHALKEDYQKALEELDKYFALTEGADVHEEANKLKALLKRSTSRSAN